MKKDAMEFWKRTPVIKQLTEVFLEERGRNVVRGCTIAECVTKILYAHHDRCASILHGKSTPRIWDCAVEKARVFYSMYSSFDRFSCLSSQNRPSFLKCLSRDVGFETRRGRDIPVVLVVSGFQKPYSWFDRIGILVKRRKVVWYREDRMLKDEGYLYA